MFLKMISSATLPSSSIIIEHIAAAPLLSQKSSINNDELFVWDDSTSLIDIQNAYHIVKKYLPGTVELSIGFFPNHGEKEITIFQPKRKAPDPILLDKLLSIIKKDTDAETKERIPRQLFSFSMSGSTYYCIPAYGKMRNDIFSDLYSDRYYHYGYWLLVGNITDVLSDLARMLLFIANTSAYNNATHFRWYVVGGEYKSLS